jgi:CHAD domain-containing protein
MTEELERARKAVRELSKTLRSLPADPPNEAVHKLRTSTRRVEAIVAALPQLEGKESRRLLKSIEPIRKATGGVRDMDVMIGNARKLVRHTAGDSLTRLVEQLNIARQHSAVELRRAIGGKRGKALENLKEYSQLIRSALKQAVRTVSANGSAHNDGIQSAAGNVVRELGEWPPLNQENIHAFRLKVKQLRYILQLSADANSGLAEALVNVQRRIGDWHDWHQLHEIASQILLPQRDSALLTRIDESCSRKFRQALTVANKFRGKYLSMPIAQGV